MCRATRKPTSSDRSACRSRRPRSDPRCTSRTSSWEDVSQPDIEKEPVPMRKRSRATVLGAIVLGSFCVPLAALADEPCSPLGLQCQAAAALDSVTDPLEDAVDDIGAIVDDLAGQADDGVGPIVDDVKDVVDDVLGGGHVVDGPGGGRESHGG